MKTDAIFYQVFQEFPQIFFELIGKIDTPSSKYQFLAPEIKQRSFRLDGIFLPVEELTDYPLYFIEVQFYKEEEFYDRFLPSIFLFLDNIDLLLTIGLLLSSLIVAVMILRSLHDIGRSLIITYNVFISTKSALYQSYQ